MEQKTKGSGFLKVSGILLIIFGVLGIIFGVVGLILNTMALIVGSTPQYISSIFLLLEGKDYVVQDGDVILFRFNV